MGWYEEGVVDRCVNLQRRSVFYEAEERRRRGLWRMAEVGRGMEKKEIDDAVARAHEWEDVIVKIGFVKCRRIKQYKSKQEKLDVARKNITREAQGGPLI